MPKRFYKKRSTLPQTGDKINDANATELIKNLFATFVINDHPGIFQDRQMLADRRKIRADCFNELTYTMLFAVSKLLDNPKPRGVSQRLKDIGLMFSVIFFKLKHNDVLCYFAI